MLHLTRAKNKNESHTMRMMSKLVGISQRLKKFCFFETKPSVTKAEP